MKKLKVIIYEPYIFKVYGNTRYLLSIFKYIDTSKIDLTLCAMYEHEFLDQIRGLGGRCVVIPTHALLKRFGGKVFSDSIPGKIKMLWAVLLNYVTLFRFLRTEKPDVVQCHSIRSLLTVGLSARFAKIPCFWYVKGELQNGVLDRLGFFIANKILFQSTINRDRRYPIVRLLLANKIEINGNGIDLGEIDEIDIHEKAHIKEEFHLTNEELKIVTIGQVTPLKGVHLLVEALIELKDTMPPFRLFIIGDHVLEKFDEFIRNLNARIKSAGIEKYIVFTGWRKDATTILSQMDLLVHPSFTEGVPKSVIEAMTLGLPVIATDVGGTPELIRQSKNGFLIQPRSKDEIKAAIVKLVNDRALMKKMGAYGASIARREYSIVDNIKRLESLYERLAGHA